MSSENNSAVVIEGEASESEDEDTVCPNPDPQTQPTNEVMTESQAESDKHVSQASTQTVEEFFKLGVIAPFFNSGAHNKLRESNIRWWKSLSSEQASICRGVTTTMKKICNRLDKTQTQAVDSSNHIRTCLTSLQKSIDSINATNRCAQNIFPNFVDNKL